MRLAVVRAQWLTIVLRNQLPDLGYKIARNADDSFRGLNASFVLDKRILLALLPVISEYPSNFLFIPSFWESCFAHCRFFLLRLRNAASGLPVNS